MRQLMGLLLGKVGATLAKLSSMKSEANSSGLSTQAEGVCCSLEVRAQIGNRGSSRKRTNADAATARHYVAT
jgi:hypothetical protein